MMHVDPMQRLSAAELLEEPKLREHFEEMSCGIPTLATTTTTAPTNQMPPSATTTQMQTNHKISTADRSDHLLRYD